MHGDHLGTGRGLLPRSTLWSSEYETSKHVASASCVTHGSCEARRSASHSEGLIIERGAGRHSLLTFSVSVACGSQANRPCDMMTMWQLPELDLEETVDILAPPGAAEAIAEGIADLEAGRVADNEGLSARFSPR